MGVIMNSGREGQCQPRFRYRLTVLRAVLGYPAMVALCRNDAIRIVEGDDNGKYREDEVKQRLDDSTIEGVLEGLYDYPWGNRNESHLLCCLLALD